jgi:hypothetical protein
MGLRFFEFLMVSGNFSDNVAQTSRNLAIDMLNVAQ